MPTQLQSKPDSSPTASARWPVDWVGIWAFCVGLAACATATLIYALSGEVVGAIFTLVASAGMIYAVLDSVSQPQG